MSLEAVLWTVGGWFAVMPLYGLFFARGRYRSAPRTVWPEPEQVDMHVWHHHDVTVRHEHLHLHAHVQLDGPAGAAVERPQHAIDGQPRRALGPARTLPQTIAGELLGWRQR